MSDAKTRQTILIVDDAPQIIAFLHGILQEEYQIFFARNGQEALQTATAKTIDLILLDIMMPGMDGFAVCEALKKQDDTREIPVIFLTATTESGDETRGLELGAVDFIAKPINPSVVKARIRTHLLLHATLHRLEELNERLLEEHEIINEIISNIQKSKPFSTHHTRALIQSVETASGDLVLSLLRPDGGQHILLGDFTGHGVTAAIAGPLVADTFHTLTLQGVLLGVICQELNSKLCTILHGGMFMASGFLELNPARTQLRVWNCGLHDILVFREGALLARIPSRFFPRGMVKGQVDLEPDTLATQPGDRVFLYSDGIVEERNGRDELFGVNRLLAALEQMLAQDQPLAFIQRMVEQFRDGLRQQDDISIVELTC